MKKILTAMILIAVLAVSFAACGTSNNSSVSTQTVTEASTAAQSSAVSNTKSDAGSSANITNANVTSSGVLNATDFFTERDLTQSADLTDAEQITLSDGQNVSITKAGVYVLSGTASNVTVTVEVEDEDKVQLVLDGVSVTNSSAPCIYVKNADKVFVTTTDSENSLTVNGSFTADGDTNTDAVIFSKDDLVLNGVGTLNISSTDNGVTSKDAIKITGGTININCTSDGLEANDAVMMAAGTVTINTQKDGIHAEKEEDNAKGYVYICGGTLNITAGDDGIHATTAAQIDDGVITISAAEGIEGTYVQVNGGTIKIEASDDGINGANKSTAYNVTVEINGGELTINMGQGDTDGIDSNGNLYINGGTINITGQSPFDYDGEAKYNGGTMIVNGTETTEITNQFGGGMGGMRGGMGGGMPDGNMPGDRGGMQGGFPGR